MKSVKEEVEEIINSFVKKLEESSINFNEEFDQEDFFLIKRKELRSDNNNEEDYFGTSKDFLENWKKTNKDKFDKENYLIAEKAKWK